MSVTEGLQEVTNAQTEMEVKEQEEDLGPIAVESLCMNCHKNVSIAEG